MPRELSQTSEVKIPTAAARVTIPDLGDAVGDPVVEQTLQKLIETAGRLVANKGMPGSGVTAPYGTIDDTGRVELSMETMKRTRAVASTKPTVTSKVPDRKIKEMTMKKMSRIIDVERNS